MSLKKDSERISVVLDKDQLKSLDDICSLLGMKQRSKAIIFLINWFNKKSSE